MTTLGKKLPHSEETKRKISIARKGINKGKPLREEQRKKVVAHLVKMNKSPEKCKQVSERVSGENNPMFGKHHSQEARKKLGETIKRGIKKNNRTQMGERNPNWKGGVNSDKEYRKLYSRIYNHKRAAKKRGSGSFTKEEWESVKINYKYTCPLCGNKEPEISLTIDHIIPIAKGGKNVILNIQPLCMRCNNKKRTKIFRITEKGALKLF